MTIFSRGRSLREDKDLVLEDGADISGRDDSVVIGPDDKFISGQDDTFATDLMLPIIKSSATAPPSTKSAQSKSEPRLISKGGRKNHPNEYKLSGKSNCYINRFLISINVHSCVYKWEISSS